VPGIGRPKLRISAFAALVACALSSPAFGQDDGFCRNRMFSEDTSDFAVGQVVGRGRLSFLEDMNGCPAATAACRQRTYVVPGDRLVTGRSKGAYVCA
jgi:hypothetical protein